jgi:hypothetical protein
MGTDSYLVWVCGVAGVLILGYALTQIYKGYTSPEITPEEDAEIERILKAEKQREDYEFSLKYPADVATRQLMIINSQAFHPSTKFVPRWDRKDD